VRNEAAVQAASPKLVGRSREPTLHCWKRPTAVYHRL